MVAVVPFSVKTTTSIRYTFAKDSKLNKPVSDNLSLLVFYANLLGEDQKPRIDKHSERERKKHEVPRPRPTFRRKLNSANHGLVRDYKLRSVKPLLIKRAIITSLIRQM